MIAGGWVCRACWRPNGPGEDRCYRCHTPKDQQLTVEAGSLTEKTKPGWEHKGRLDAQLPILAYLTAWPLRAYGTIEIGLGALAVLAGSLSTDRSAPDVLGLRAATFVSLLGVFLIVIGFLQIFLANSVRRHARWAYVVALLLGIGGSAPRMLGLSVPVVTTGVASTGWWVGAWLYLAMAVCAGALLLTSFIRRPAE